MKLFLLDSISNKELITFLLHKFKGNIELLKINSSVEEVNAAILSKSIVLIPPGAPDAFYFISCYLAEYRVVPKQLQRPIILLNNACDYIVNNFLVKYRKFIPGIPKEEISKYYLMYKKHKADFFLDIVGNDTYIGSSIEQEVQRLTNLIGDFKLPKKLTVVSNDDVSFISEKFSNIDIKENKSDIKSDRPMVFMPAAAYGKNWDADGRSNIYYSIGKILADLGFAIINGGPDGGKDSSGPIYHSSLGAKAGKAKIYGVYSALVLRKFVSKSKLEEFKDISIAISATEAQRKLLMVSSSTAVVVLPGAIGTFAEIEEAIKQDKKIILCNIKTENGYFFDQYLELLRRRNLADAVVSCKIEANMKFQEIRNGLIDVLFSPISNQRLNSALSLKPAESLNLDKTAYLTVFNNWLQHNKKPLAITASALAIGVTGLFCYKKWAAAQIGVVDSIGSLHENSAPTIDHKEQRPIRG